MPKGNWLATVTGKHVYPLDFRPEMFNILDVAHALSMSCRFTGHTFKFYSVAEHCVLMSDIARERDEASDKPALQALLHDAAEAYIHDIAQPLKVLDEFALYRDIERGIEQVIYEMHGLPPRLWPEIKDLDRAMLLAEGRYFFPNDVRTWDYPDPKTTENLNVEFEGWSPKEARNLFLMQYNKLTGRHIKDIR